MDARVYRETEAVLAIVARCERGELTWISSEILDFEAGQARDREPRRVARTH